jgi:ArsR family transcriptional regulator, arsenate/arsenite/antimonite-responsive transcriptional repressor / arsenate reductase (thioredoxin)
VAITAAEIPPLEFLQLVAEPHRWRLLHELTQSDRRVGELTELLAEPQNLVSYHLAELRRAGLVSARRSSADGRDTYYRIEPQRCRELLNDVGDALQPGLRVTFPADPGEMRGRRPRILFLCTGNSARSQMAEALIEHLSDQQIVARSAGSHPKPLHPNTVRVLAERGIDVSDRRTKHLGRFAEQRFDRVITLCDKVREVCPEFPSGPTTSHWSIADPTTAGETDEEIYAAFERTADDITDRIAQLMSQMKAEADERSAS